MYEELQRGTTSLLDSLFLDDNTPENYPPGYDYDFTDNFGNK